MRRLGLVSTLAAATVAALALAAGPAGAAAGFGSGACLRGNWVANQAETNRVLRALVPVGGFEAKGTRSPGGSVPFQCRGATLRVMLPRFASLSWITLHRG